MKRDLFCILLLCLTILTAKAQVTIYGFATNVDDEKQSGLITFSSTDPTHMQRVKQVEEWATAGAWGGDAYYAMLSYATYPKGLYTIDVETGDMQQIADYMYNERVRAAIEMSYDFTSGIMYMITVSDEDENCTAFGTVDLKTGEQKTISPNMGQYIVAMAINKSGRIYGINDAGTLVSIDKKTGKCTNRTNLGVYPWRRQSMEFDRKSGDLYWAYCDSDEFGHLKKIKVNTGTVTDIGNIGNTGREQVVGLYIPYSECEDGAPQKVTDLQLAPDPTGGLSATLSWTCPTTTYIGEELTEIGRIEIYRNEMLVATLTDVAPGAAMTWTDQVAASGEYTYRVVPCNSAGPGVLATLSGFIGYDIPETVTIASVSREGNNAICLAWHPCTKGANNGYLDISSIAYKVTRTNDGAVLAEGMTDTTFTDNSITTLGRYQYAITAYHTNGESEPAMTGYIVNGPARDLPMTTDFTNEDESKLWTIFDADMDGTTFFWQYNPNFKDQGFFYYQCEYTPATHADDWIISPQYRFEAGKAYKAIIYARPDDVHKNEKMEVWLVKDYNLSTAVNLSDTLHVTGEYDENGETILSQFRVNIEPLDEAGEYSIGVRCVSDLEVAYWLAIARVEVSENQEGHIRGDVYDDGLNPVEGVIVSLEGTDYKAVTDVRGQFEIKNVPEGTYNSIQTKLGYFTVPQTVSVKGLKTVNVELDVVKRKEYSYQGNIKNEYGEPLSGATVNIRGYNAYTALTDKDGDYRIDGIYELAEGEVRYKVEARKDFYQSDTTSLDPMEVNGFSATRDFVLNDDILPPAYASVQLTEDEGTAVVNWSAPAIEHHVKLHSDVPSYTFGTEEGEAGTLIGLVCREAMLIDSLQWWTFSDSATLNVVILALDERGRLSDKELYRDDAAPNDPYDITTYRLNAPAYAPYGCFIGISVDRGNLSLITTLSTEESPFIFNTNAYIEDLATSLKLEYVEDLGSDYEENFYMSYSGRQIADKEAPAVNYKVVAMANGADLYDAVGTKFIYTDPAWANLDKGEYQYAVEAVYRNGGKARLLTDVVTKTTPSVIQPLQMGTVVKVEEGMLLIDAEAVQIVSAGGEVIMTGSGLHEISTEGWAGGLYLVRTLKNSVWETNKIVIK